MLEEKLGYRKYDIEPIIDKFYSFLERELKKFGETDDEDRAQKFDDYIKSNFAKPYDEDTADGECLFIGTFKGSDYVVKIYITHYSKLFSKNSFSGSRYSASRFQCWAFS